MNGFKIGNIQIESPLIMAPLAGYTSSAFRLLVKEAGCALVFTEVISTKGMLYNNNNTWKLLKFHPEERPIGIQLLTSDPGDISEAIRLIKLKKIEPDIIDINLGCPKPKIVSKREGGALLQDTERTIAVVKAACKTASVPVTVKLRLLQKLSIEQFIDFLLRIEDCGVSAITLHPRTVKEGFRNHARWDLFEKIASSLSIPLIASGDVKTAQHVTTVLSSGCSGVMIGRAAIGDPFIFKRIKKELEGDPISPPSSAERLSVCLRHLKLLKEEKDERHAVLELRKQLSQYLRGFSNSKKLTRKLVEIAEYNKIKETLEILIKKWS